MILFYAKRGGRGMLFEREISLYTLYYNMRVRA